MGDWKMLLGAWPQKVVVICALIFVCSGSVMSMADHTKCIYYDPEESSSPLANYNYTCDLTNEGKKQHCYALWRNNSEGGGFQWIKRGCWLPNPSECESDTCIGTPRGDLTKGDNIYYCCCRKDRCNQNVTQIVVSAPVSPPSPTMQTTPPAPPQLYTVLMSLVPLTSIAVVVAVIYWLWRRHHYTYNHEALPTHDPAALLSPCQLIPPVPLKPVQLHAVCARGRFGKVWRASLTGQAVAVKELPLQEARSWETERDIYMLPHMNTHEHILTFYGAERRGEHTHTLFWLITEFHPRGSLYDYLKGHLVTWCEVVQIAETMSAGLAFLHEEIPPSGEKSLGKPPVAHRDFKSKNVLLKQDGSACIADFGLALKFDPSTKTTDTHGQVGTRRYMAPEVLEGAINFSLDSFLRIDMYATGLVFWELLSRCSAAEGPVEDYRLPFEEEVGLHPSLEDMQDVVVHKKKRPLFKEAWSKHLGIKWLYDCMEECWDADAEARLSACCMYERLSTLTRTTNLTTGQTNENTDNNDTDITRLMSTEPTEPAGSTGMQLPQQESNIPPTGGSNIPPTGGSNIPPTVPDISPPSQSSSLIPPAEEAPTPVLLPPPHTPAPADPATHV